MKIFHRDGKVNFVDENNVLVGFDYQSDCCEEFGYFFTSTPPTSLNPFDVLAESDERFAGFVFDISYHANIGFESDCDSAAAVFRLDRGNEVIYLTLHNTHNGYYTHGFEMTHNGITIHSGGL